MCIRDSINAEYGNRDKALYCLKRRKAQERHIERTFGLLQNIETMIHEVDARQLDTEVAEALRAATGELKAINDHLSLDEVAEIMDSAQEQIRITEEVSELLSQNLTFQDEALLEDELNGLMEPKAATKQQTSITGGVLEGVTVPGHELPPTTNPVTETPQKDEGRTAIAVSYTHLRAHETPEHLVCRLLLEKKKKKKDCD
eukprot:TRINITY_DN24962_c0_g1_i1.p1 TRINITY_DN24962_c0_g1~~TRINITY_DN24962_c0_g1_i1.p1  ORF type:complete len:201 (-),score=72.06 TRINITY_DN24962_c0_g1_i1:87-689(-)